MKILQLKNKVNGFASIDFNGVDMAEVLKSGNVAALQGKSFSWNRDSGETISDAPFFIGAMPIFATEKLGDALAGTNVRTATFDVEGESFTIVAAPEIPGQVINLNESKYRAFRSGKIMTVSDYVFNSGINYPSVFTLQEFKMFTFCNADIAKRLLSCRFAQLELVDCPIR